MRNKYKSNRKVKKSMRHSDGYTKEKTLDLKVAAGDKQRQPYLLPLASKPATRANLDLYFEPTHELYHNGGYTNILTRFQRVDDYINNSDARNVQQCVPDYIINQINYLAPAYLNTEYSNYIAIDTVQYQSQAGQTVYSPGSDDDYEETQANLTMTWSSTKPMTVGDFDETVAYSSYLTRRNYDRNVWFQWLYNKFANNSAFSGIEAMNPAVYSLNDTNPLNYNSATSSVQPQINSFMAQWDAVNQNMLYLVLCLRMYKITKALLNKFADRHLGLSGYISQAVSAISTLRYVKLLDNASELLSKMPCDIDYIENYTKRQIPSMTGSSYYDPILIPTWAVQKPQYQIQWEGGSPFTPWCENKGYATETSALTWTEDGFSQEITYNGNSTTLEMPAGYPVVIDDYNNTYYYYESSNSDFPTGWYAMQVLAPYMASDDGKIANMPTTIRADYLLQQLQNNRTADGASVSSYMQIINSFRENWLSFLQTLVDNISRFNMMMAPFASMYELIENSGLAKYHAKRWEWDIELTNHYDGWQWDWIKHPEVCIQSINNVANTTINSDNAYLNAHNQYAAGIAMRYEKYDEHIVDSNSMYSVTASWYYNTWETWYYGNTLFVTPFTDYQTNQDEINVTTNESFDNNYVSLNTYMIPKALIAPVATVYTYCGDSYTMQVTDYDNVQIQVINSMIGSNSGNVLSTYSNSEYPQAWIPVGQFEANSAAGYAFTVQYLIRIFGVIGITDESYPDAEYGESNTLQLTALFTDGYTSYLPVTLYNDISKYYDETVSEHPFTVKTKPNAQKVLQVAN